MTRLMPCNVCGAKPDQECDLSKHPQVSVTNTNTEEIEKLKQENEKLKQQLEIAETTLAKASPDYFNLYQKIIDDIEHENVENE